MVTLENLDASEINIPPSVTIPAGAQSATFPIDAVDDNILDGTQRARINARNDAYTFMVESREFVFVEDQEPTLVITLDESSVFENSGFLTGTLSRENDLNLDDLSLIHISEPTRPY